jgi:hypothetical protein
MSIEVNVMSETEIVPTITVYHMKITVQKDAPIQYINRKNRNLLEPAKMTMAAAGLVAYIAVAATSYNTAP